MESSSSRRSPDDVPLVFEVPVFFELSDGSPSWSRHGAGALRRSGSRGDHPPRLPQNRTCAVHIRLFGTAGCEPRRRPVCDLSGTANSTC